MKNLKFGVILRYFAKKVSDIDEIESRMLNSINKLAELGIENIVVVVPVKNDCGETAERLNSAVKMNSPKVTPVVIDSAGSYSPHALNVGLYELKYLGTDIALPLSDEAVCNLSSKILSSIEGAFNKGARVVWVTVDKRMQIMKKVCTDNTFTAWSLPELMDIGCFESDIGIEEIAPSVRLLRRHGPCIAILEPVNFKELTVGGEINDKEVTESQAEEFDRMDVPTEFFEKGIMEGFPLSI